MATSPGHLLHLIAWAQVGVCLRIYIELLLGRGCSPSHPWIPCLTSDGMRDGGAFFVDLPVNVIGSFLMGLFVSSDVLSNSLRHTLTVEAPMAMLPTRSPLQTHLPFQVGIRTGLCGSLTTFASWQLQMVIMFVGGKPLPGGSQWVEAISGLIVGCLCSLAALVMGQHVALLIYHKLNPGAFIPFGSPAPEQLLLEQSSAAPKQLQKGTSTSLSVTASGRAVMRTVSAVRRGSAELVLVDVDMEPTHHSSRAAAGALELSTAPGALTQESSGTSLQDSLQQQQQQHLSPFAGSAAQQQQQQPLGAASSLAAALASSATPDYDNSGGLAEVITESDVKRTVQQSPLSVLLVDGFALATIALLSGISIWRIVGHSKGDFKPSDELPFADPFIWWAILFGPVGCYLRYYLSRYNGALSGTWKWLPVGTYAANMLACLLDYVIKAIEVRVLGLSALQLAVLNGMMSGIGGSLSTVSTWVVEVQRLLLSFPNSRHGYDYLLLSLGSAVVLGLVVYGIPVWTL